MTDTNTTVELDRREWRQILSIMNLGIETADDRGFTKVASARESIHDDIESQVCDQYDGGVETLDDVVERLVKDLDISRSLHVEETGRTVAHLRD